MASDSLYLIEILLQARDQTSAAVQKAIANLSGLEAAEKKAGREADQMSEKFKRTFKDFDEHSVKLKNTQEELKRLGASSEEALKAQERLDKATRAHQRTLTEYGATSRKAQLALHAVAEEQERVTKASGEATAELVRLNAATEEHAKIQEETAERIAKADENSMQRRAKAAQDLEAILDAAERDHRARNDRDAENFLDSERKKTEAFQAEQDERRRIIEEYDQEQRQKRDREASEFLEDEAKKTEARRQAQADLKRTLDRSDQEARARREQDAQEFLAGEKTKERAQAERARATTTRERDYQSALRETLDAEQEAGRAKTAGAPERIQTKLDADVAAAMAKLEAAAVVIRDLDGTHINVKLDLDSARFLAQTKATASALRDVGNEGRNTNSIFGILRRNIAGVGTNFDSSTSRIAAFDNLLRGLVTLGITIFLQQLVQVGGALVGMLGALVASAVQAGAALGGALVAGATQALPVIGVLAVAVSRVKGVMDAMKQANLLQQQESYKGTQEANKQANALDGVTSAHEALANAQRGVAKAQENLTKTRRDAVRQIQDLILAERAAELAAEGAALSQEDAQRALQAAIAGGGDVARAQLQVKEANLGVDQSARGLQTAQRNLREGQRPEQTDSVKSARESLADARRAQAQAERSLDHAQRASQIADANISAASGKLAFLRSQMSDAENALLDAMLRLQTRFHAFGKDISEPIIVQFTFAVNRVTRLLGDDKIKNAARLLSSSVAGSLGGIFRSFTGKGTIDQLLGFAEEAQKNLKPIESILRNLGHAFLNLGQIAGPTLRHLLDSIAGVAHNFRAFTESESGQHKIREFLHDGLTALKSWATLLFNVARLFLAISGAGGAQTGTTAVKDMGKAIGDAADEINTKGSKAQEFFEKFFETSRKVVDALKPIFVSLAEEFQKTFGNDTQRSVEGFASIIADVIIPAIGEFIRKVGSITTAIGDFVKEHPGVAKFAASFLGILLVATALSKVLTIFGPLVSVFKVTGKIIGDLVKASPSISKFFTGVADSVGFLVTHGTRLTPLLVRMSALFGRFSLAAVAPWAAIAAAVVFLLAKMGLLDDSLKALGGFFSALWEEVEPPLGRLFDSFGKLWEAIKEGRGAFGLLGGAFGLVLDALKPIVKILIDIGAVVLDVFGHGLGRTIGGALDVISGLINTVVALLSGDWEGAWEGAKQVIKGLLNVFTGMPQAIAEKALELGKSILDGLVDGLAAMPEALLGLFTGAFDGVLRWLGIKSPSTRARSWGRSIVDGLVSGLRGLARAALGIFTGFADRVWEGLKTIGRFGKKIVDLIRDGLRVELRGLKNIGTWIWETLRDNVTGIYERLKGVGKSLVTGLIDGLKSARNLFRDAVRDLIGSMPGGGIILGAIDKVGGALRKGVGFVTDRFATGGPVPGSGSGDTVPALLTPGEHVLTRGEVAAAGGHAAIFALRRMLGGGLQGGPLGYADGGAVYDPISGAMHGGGTAGRVATQQQRNQETAERKKTLETEREDYRKSNSQRAEDWRVMWSDMLITSRRATNDIQTQIREMRVGVTATMKRLYTDVRGYVAAIENSFTERGANIAQSWSATYKSLGEVVYDGLTYIGHQTNLALKALGGENINFHFSKPSQTAADVSPKITLGTGKTVMAASGGFIGNSGERGRDAVPAMLGRGEAVLNWAHQKLVNSALWNTYGTTLPEMFRRNFAYHAGGYGAPGYATGGLTGPHGSGAAFNAIAKFAQDKFRLTMTAGRTDHGLLTSTGNVSDHSWGGAGDFSNASQPTPEMDGFNAFWKTKAPQVVKQLIWRGKDQFRGFPISDHFDHVHLAVQRSLAFNLSKMAKIISRASRGLSIAELMSGATDSEGAPAVDHVRKISLEGAGPLLKGLQRLFNTVVGKANTFIDSKAGDFSPSGGPVDYDEHGKGALSQGQVESTIRRALGILNYDKSVGLIVKAFTRQASRESGFNPNAENKTAAGVSAGGPMGLLQVVRGTFDAYKYKNYNAPFKALDNVLASLRYVAARYGGGDLARGAQVLWDRGGGAYARGGIVGNFGGYFAQGGIVPGGPGAPVPIVAHAGEWVLNQVQQSKLAGALGTGLGQLRDYLGFTGGPGSFQGGGQVLQIGDSLSVGIRDALKKLIPGLVSDARVGRNSDEAVAVLKRKLKDAYKEVIFDVGTNDGHASMLKRNLKKAHQLLNEDQSLVVSTVRGPGAAAKNRVIRQFADQYENVRLVQAPTRGSAGDAIHYTAAGYQKRAKLFADAVKKSADDVDKTADAETKRSVAGIRSEISKALAGVQKLGKISTVGKLGKLLQSLGGAGGFLGEGNLFERIESAIEEVATRAENTIALAMQGFVRIGNRIRRAGKFLVDPEIIARLERRVLDRTGRSLESVRRVNAELLTDVDRALTQIERGGVSSKEKERYQQLVGKRQELSAKLAEYDAKIAQNAADRFSKRIEEFDAATAKQLRGSDRSAARADFRRSIATAFGQEDRVATAERESLDALVARRDVLRQRLEAARDHAKHDPRWRAKAKELADQVNELTVNITEATVAVAKAGYDAINTRYERAASAASIQQRIRSALGNRRGVLDLAGATIQQLKNHQGELQNYLRNLDPRNVGLAREVQAQIDDLGAQITEGAAQLIQDEISFIEETFSKTSARLDVRGRAADLVERMGDRLSAINLRRGISTDRLTALGVERGGYAAQLGQAVAQGNLGAIEDLTDKISALDQTIAEETQATQDLVYQYRQTSVDIIQGRTSRATGLIGSAQDLLSKIAVNAGGVYDPRALLEKAGQELAKAIPGIANNVLSGAGEFGGQAGGVLESLRSAFLAGPGDFATKLAELGPTIADLESTMGDAQKTTFQALIQAMLDNTSQVVDNTKSLKDATGALSGPQSFASSSWSWFRNALFSGMGDVLPQYQIPHMQSGGSIRRGGLFALHPGEFVVNPEGSNVPDSGDINITMNSINGDVDLTALAARVAFAKKSRG